MLTSVSQAEGAAPIVIELGARLGPYSVEGRLGEGGMGVVYRARDTRLDRPVAIKALHQKFSARFEREARAISALNHPNVCTLYDVGPNYLVMELVEGPALAERMRKGPVPLDEALAIARQIAAALDAAHARGIVHRDLKPGNIKLQDNGTVKVLDFGLATNREDPESQDADATRALSLTEAGSAVGTPAYMAPEQAQAKPVDKRVDIWAFGVTLYEMISGKPLFRGASTAETLAAVLTRDVDWNAVPPQVRRLLRKCLERDPRKRLRDIGDFEMLLDDAKPADGPAPPARRAWRGLAAIAALASTAIGLGAALWHATRSELHAPVRFTAELGPNAVERPGQGMDLALSQDGARIAYLVRPPGGALQVATRRLDESAQTILPGTEDATGVFLSPNGQWAGFFANGKIKKTPVAGGPVIALCDANDARGAWWGTDGYIVANLSLGGGLFRIPESGGTPQPITDPAVTGDATHRWPQILPGGNAVLFTGHKITMNYDEASIEVLSLKTGKWKPVLHGGYFGRYVPTGHLIYVNHSTLYGVAFDLAKLEIKGTPVPLLADVPGNRGNAAGRFAAHNGMLIYFGSGQGQAPTPIVWLDGGGKSETIPVEPGNYTWPRLSPDGSKLALTVENRSGSDIVIYDFQRQTTAPLTFSHNASRPIWTPDGNHIVYMAEAPSALSLQWVRAGGAGEPHTLYKSTNELLPWSFSPDGRVFLFTELIKGGTYHLLTMPLDLSDPENPKPGESKRLLPSDESLDSQGEISPDGKWVAYIASASSGSGRLMVRPFPPGLGEESVEWQVSASAGAPVWERGGNRLYFREQGQIMAVDYTVVAGAFSAGKPRRWPSGSVLFADPVRGRTVDISAGGRRMIVVTAPQPEADPGKSTHVEVILNFFDELQRRIPR